ncbi:MAG: ornithine carbamoyltransferase [Vampirovibrionales bacterium]|nr:ornithine carbamoyltransferase [Vampirovibrionales bacterium]
MSISVSPNNLIVSLKDRDFLALSDYTPEEIKELLAFAGELKLKKKNRETHSLLAGKSVAMYFEKPSNRTRVSFEVGIFDLGAHPIMLKKEEINLGVRETIADTARTLSRYVDGIMIRTFRQGDVEELAQYASVPVINGLTDDHHPCQVMADLLTIQEHLGNFKGRKLTYVGDGNNMAHSLMEGCALVGMDVTIACPSGFTPKVDITEKAKQIAAKTGAKIDITDDIALAAKDASVLYTDVWASMGQEAEAEDRKEKFKDFQINAKLLEAATSDAIVLHCLPAHRGEEITNDVLEQHAQVIFDQAENRLHAQKAVLAALIG